MKVLEFEAKTLLGEQDLPIPRGKAITSSEEAVQTAQNLDCPVVLKVQIPMGGRMKAGGVQFAEGPGAVADHARRLLGSEILGFTVDRILVEESVDIQAEVFVGAIYDDFSRAPVLLASASGGIDVEAADTLFRRPFSVMVLPGDYVGREVAAQLGFDGRELLRLGSLITQVARCFLEWDATLLEINPLALDAQGRWWVADVHLELDEDAIYRQTGLLEKTVQSAQLAVPQSDFERRAIEINKSDHRGVAGRLVPFDGELGLLIGGGGASLTAFDAVLDAGLRPANYCEIGGNPSVWKIQELTKLILSQPQVERLAVIMNVVSNTRVDLVARGVIKGILQLDRDPSQIIAAFRIPGSWEEEGRAILEHYGVPCFGREKSIDQVVEGIKWQS